MYKTGDRAINSMTIGVKLHCCYTEKFPATDQCKQIDDLLAIIALCVVCVPILLMPSCNSIRWNYINLSYLVDDCESAIAN